MHFTHLGKTIAVTICEDIWNSDKELHAEDPLEELSGLNIDLLINLSASPGIFTKLNNAILFCKKLPVEDELPSGLCQCSGWKR